MRKTKIICTLGPASSSEDIIKKMMLAGMNMGRINFSHGTHEENKIIVDAFMKSRDELRLPIPLLLDTKGPEIRIGKFETGSAEVVKGQEFVLTTRNILGNRSIVSVSHKGLVDDVSVGAKILIADGLIELNILRIEGTEIICEVENGGVLGNQKNVNVPGTAISLPALTQKDIDDIKFGIENGFDMIAASFIRKASDIYEIRRVLSENGGSDIMIVAKIENSEGIDNINEIIEASDGIMIARGDLGVQIPIEDIPVVQKMLIEKCYSSGKPAITATQMLESMIVNPRPTRAEATDIANAIYDGTSAIMLSGESASGKYPIESVETMARIAKRAEESIDYKGRFNKTNYGMQVNITNAISHATCATAHLLDAVAIITSTTSGKTARNVSKFRPSCPIIATTTSERVQRQLSLSWGVTPLLLQLQDDSIKLFDEAVETARDNGFITYGDLVVITGGTPVGIVGTTNTIKVQIVGVNPT